MGTELFKHYSADKTPFLKCGYNNLWNVYHGTHKARKQQVCIFVLEKKNLKKVTKNTKEALVTIRKSASVLAKFKHPNILSLVEPLVEDKNCIGFVTERFNYSLNSWLDFINPSKLEIKAVLIELCKSLIFLHEDAHVIHNNLSLDSVFIDENNQIKLGFMEFSVNDPAITGADITVDNILQNFSFLAPELIFDSKAYYTSDVYSIGLIAYYLLKYHKGEKDTTLLALSSNNTVEGYKSFFNSNADNKLSKLSFDIEDNELIRKCLIRAPTSRPILKELIDHSWFNDPKLKALNFIEHLDQNDTTKNSEFLQKFPKIINMFENKIIEKRFLPALLNGLKNESLVVPCLPPIFAIAEKSDIKINFQNQIWPGLKTLFALKSMPASGLYFLLSKVKFIGDHISNSEFTSTFLNVICKAMDCNVLKIQTVVSENLLCITKKIDSLSFKNQIYPRIISILTNTNSQSLKIQLLTSLKSLYTQLDQNIINENLLTNLDKIRKGDNSAEICMLISSIYEEIAKIVSVNSIANKILPNLISILVSGNISKGNFDTLMQLVHKYLDRIKKDREKDLFDDKKDGQTNDIFLNDNNKIGKNEKGDIGGNDDFLASFFGGSSNNTNSTTTVPSSSKQNDFDFGKISLPGATSMPTTTTTTSSTTNQAQPSSSPFDFQLSNKANTNINIRNSNTVSNPIPSSQSNKNPFSLAGPKNNSQQPISFDNVDFTSTNKSKSIVTPFNTPSTNINQNNPFDFVSPAPVKTQNKQEILDNLLNDLGTSTKNPPASTNTGFGTNTNKGGFNEMSLDFLNPNYQKPNTNTNSMNMNFGTTTINKSHTFDFNQMNTLNTNTNIQTNTNMFNFDLTNQTGTTSNQMNNQTNFNYGNNQFRNVTNQQNQQSNNPFNF